MNIAPWIPPLEPDLARLAMASADQDGIPALRAWPEHRKGGIGFQALPPFLSWCGQEDGRTHLVLLQPRELGALVPGAHGPGLPEGWLRALDLEALARPLSRHPDLGGSACVHVVHLPGPGRAVVRSLGPPGEAILREVLARLSGLGAWAFLLEA